jgi:ATP-dependent Clp protease ATP-binding subunit ClpA
LIRWERKIGLASLEEMGVDLHSLADKLDALLTRFAEERPTVARRGVVVDSRTGERILFDPAPALAPLLEQAVREARQLGHNYVGSEHLLLAVISSADSELAAILDDHLIAHDGAQETILELLG